MEDAGSTSCVTRTCEKKTCEVGFVLETVHGDSDTCCPLQNVFWLQHNARISLNPLVVNFKLSKLCLDLIIVPDMSVVMIDHIFVFSYSILQSAHQHVQQ